MKKLWNEFKAFAFKGNVLDLAIGMIIGAAFTAIVTALVNSIIMPLLSILTGSVNFESMKWVIGDKITIDAETGIETVVKNGTEIPYGAFLQAIFVFLATAICLFFVVKGLNKLTNMKKKDEPAPAPKEEPRLCPFCKQEIHKDATRCPHCTSDLTGIDK